MKLFSLVWHGFSRPKKYFILLSVLTALCIVFTCFADTFYQIMFEISYSEAIYGDYTGRIENAGQYYKQLKDALQSAEAVEYTIPYYFEQKTKSNEATLYGVDSEFWSHTEYELIEGDYPQNDRELVCDPTYLYRFQLQRDRMIGAEILFHGNTYRVCGLYHANRLYTDGTEEYNRICFTLLTAEPNSCVYRIENSSTVQMQRILDENSIPLVPAINWNDFVKQKTRSQMNIIVLGMFLLLLVTICALIVHCISLILIKHKKHIEIYQLIGIPTNKVRHGFALRIIMALLLGAGCSVLLYGLVLVIIYIMYHSISGLAFSVILSMLPVKHMLKMSIAFIIIIALFSLAAPYAAVKKAEKQQGAQEYNVHINALRGKLPQNISSTRIALRHIRVSVLSTFGTAIVLAVTIVAFHGVRLFFQTTAAQYMQYDGYQYRISSNIDTTALGGNIDFSGSDAQSEEDLEKLLQQYLEKWNDLYSSLRAYQQENLDVLKKRCPASTTIKSLYYSYEKASVSKSIFSDELRSYLTSLPAYHDAILTYGQDIRLPLTLVALDQLQLEQLSPNVSAKLKEDDCLIYTQFTSELKGEQLLFEVGDTLNIGESLLQIVGTTDDFDEPLIQSNNTITVLMNQETYRKITSKSVPTDLFLQVDDDDKTTLEAIFKDLPYLEVYNLEVSEQTKKLQLCQKWFYSFAISFLVTFTLFCSILIIYMRCILFEREYSDFHLFGIQERFTGAVIRKEVHTVLLPAVAFSAGLLELVLHIYNIKAAEVKLMPLDFPIIGWLNSCLILECIGLFAAKYLTKKFDKIMLY